LWKLDKGERKYTKKTKQNKKENMEGFDQANKQGSVIYTAHNFIFLNRKLYQNLLNENK